MRNKTIWRILATFITVVIVMSGIVVAQQPSLVSSPAIIYVPDGYATIQAAVDAALPGDTIIVRDGSYIENADVDKRLTIKSENGSANCIVQAENPADHVFEVTADYVNISEFTATGTKDYSEAGIYLGAGVDHCNILNNNVSNNNHGIYLYYSSSNNLTNNTANSDVEGIKLSYSSDNIITNNKASNSWGHGIELYFSNNSILTNNIVSSIRMPGGSGVHLWNSRNNTVKSNNLENSGISITATLAGYELSSFNTHTIEGNTINGKPIYYYKNISGIKIPEDAREVILANCTDMTVENLNASFGSIGIELAYTTNSKISNNIASWNTGSGIHLTYGSVNNTITNNTLNSNRLYSIFLSGSSNNVIANNTINSNLNYGFWLTGSSNNKITNNNISNNFNGFWLSWGSNNNISNNTVSANKINGIHLYSSDYNSITSNNASNNGDDGIYLAHSSNNKIYLNNFINNTNNVYSYNSSNTWNSTEPITYQYNDIEYTNYTGNYWDDYTGSDGDSDGIGVTPYSIDGDKDNYPLMEPWENYFKLSEEKIFDTDSPANPYPSIFGTHNGTIKPNHTVIATKIYTYPCTGTGGHTEYAKIWNSTWNATATWKGYVGDWHNISFDKTVVLLENKTYNYTLRTGSYPQIHHTPALPTENGWINCTEFVDANGKRYDNWIPAIRLE